MVVQGMMNDQELAALSAAVARPDADDLALVDGALRAHPDDPRLHFLYASLCAAHGRSVQAHGSFMRALEIAPDFAVARFQTGLFELTSGEASEALATWGPLLRLPEENYFRQFVEGLTHMIRDEFGPAIARFRRGIALNIENPPLNDDMNMLIEQCETLAGGGSPDMADEGSSPTSFVLNQFSRTRH
ncbi:tetratricopeptide repeat protein [Novosphingopyxis sp.]|uniref:tetratricopeptide repeat protein n=1 Tax=Novosphingopyxis sp. TaxID=2709690 RepID=UPI003B5A6758